MWLEPVEKQKQRTLLPFQRTFFTNYIQCLLGDPDSQPAVGNGSRPPSMKKVWSTALQPKDDGDDGLTISAATICQSMRRSVNHRACNPLT